MRARDRCVRMLVGVAAAAVLGGGLQVAAQSRETLETKVTVDGDTILLDWSKKHPWDTELLASGAFLLAEYRTQGGTVVLDCLDGADDPRQSYNATSRRAPAARPCQGVHSTPSRDRDDRTLRFHLPDQLTASPAGPVCLYIRLQNQRLLPIRRSNQRGDDTAHFRHERWEKEAAKRAQSVQLRARIQSARADVSVRAENVQKLEASNAARGWQSASACQAIQAPAMNTGRSERPLAQAAQHNDVAQMVCVMRVANAGRALAELPFERRVAIRIVQPPATLDRVLSMLRALPNADESVFTSRQSQVGEFHRQWDRWSTTVETYKAETQRAGYALPHFGTFEATITMQSLSGAQGASLAKDLSDGKEPDATDIAGVVGGTLDAYFRCISDGKAQLETAFTNANELLTRTPLLQARAREQLVQACQEGISKLDGERAKHEALKSDLARDEQAFEALGAFAPIPRQSKVVNDVACAP
ncbi:MAG TPA: hypothetical protein VMS40_02665 [Vicinamibacterales bacterium]|nr:hypothetical protein [Vicinamibacterales bacterium]